eukprot:909099-Lingulodinium_polyedra.AAC.1
MVHAADVVVVVVGDDLEQPAPGADSAEQGQRARSRPMPTFLAEGRLQLGGLVAKSAKFPC